MVNAEQLVIDQSFNDVEEAPPGHQQPEVQIENLTGQSVGSHPPSRPVATTIRRPVGAAEQRAEHLQARRVEPMDILGYQQCGLVADARH